MTIDDLRILLDYHYWARDRLLSALEPLSADELTADRGNSFKSIRDTVAHILGAEMVWYSRWEGQPIGLPSTEQYPSVESLRAAWLEHERKVRSFVEALGAAGVDRVFAYKLFNGTPEARPFGHLLQHLVNHATYHRGQVTTMLRQMGATPPASMDLIAYYRETR